MKPQKPITVLEMECDVLTVDADRWGVVVQQSVRGEQGFGMRLAPAVARELGDALCAAADIAEAEAATTT